MTTVETDVRAEYIAGLRKLADALEANPTIDTPYTGRGDIHYLNVHAHRRGEMSAWAQLLDDATEALDGKYYAIKGHLGGVSVQVVARAELLGRTVTREVEQFEVEPILPVQP